MFDQHDDYKPVTWVRGNPLYATHVMVGFFAVTMIVATILGARLIVPVVDSLGFFTGKIYEGQLWRFLTYGLVNPPSISFVIEMLMILWFGRELERFFGRKVFLIFFGALYLFVPLVLTLLGMFRVMTLVGFAGGFGCFIAFATLYPGVLLIFNIPAKWLAIVVIGISSLIAVYSRDLVGLINLWATVGFACSFVRYHQGRLHMPRLRWMWRKPKFRVISRGSDADVLQSLDESEDDANDTEVDDLLEKIARNGINSLTKEERARLEQARENLLRKERR